MANKIHAGWLACLLLLFGCSAPADFSAKEIGLPYYSSADFTPVWPEAQDEPADTIHTIAPFILFNQDGDTLTEESVRGKIYVANFFFTICPLVCPRMTANLQRVQEAVAHDDSVLLVSHSVMPWVDSVATLQDYAVRNGISSGKWHLLTGPGEEIYRLARESYFADEGFGKDITSGSDFLHTENIWLIDSQGRIRGIYNGTLPLEMTRLVEDIGRLKKEKNKKG